MPKVPIYEQQVSVQPPKPSTPTLSAPPASAFGTGISEAGARVGSAAMNASEGIARIMLAKQQEEQEKQVFQIDADVRKRVSDLLFNKETDDKGKPKGLLNRQLGNATGVTVEFDESYRGLREDILGGELSDFQRNALSKMLETHYSSTRETLIKHEAREGEADYKNSMEADLKQRIQDAAAINDPAKLKDFMAESLAVQNIGYARLGVDQNTREQGNKALIAGLVESSLKGMIETNPALARQMLNPMKADLPPDVFEQLDSKVLDAEFVAKLTAAKQQGVLKPEALKMAADPYFARTSLEKTVRMEAVNKLYATTDYGTYMNLWERVQTQAATPAEIDREFANGRITQQDAESLRKDLFSARNSGSGSSLPPAIKMVMDQVKIEAEKKYKNKTNGKGQKLLDTFMYVVKQKASQTQDPAELMKFAEDMKKEVKVSDGWWFFDSYKPGFEVSFEQQKSRLLELGTLKSMVGDDVVNGLAQSIMVTTGKNEVGINDLGAFVNELAAITRKPDQDPTPQTPAVGISNSTVSVQPAMTEAASFSIMSQGTPVNNAIRSLLLKRKAVTPQAVKAVLDAYPDGNWR